MSKFELFWHFCEKSRNFKIQMPVTTDYYSISTKNLSIFTMNIDDIVRLSYDFVTTSFILKMLVSVENFILEFSRIFWDFLGLTVED